MQTMVMNMTLCVPVIVSVGFILTACCSLLSSALIVIGCLLNAVLLNYTNKRKIRKQTELLALYSYDRSDALSGGRAWSELGDQHPNF